jgi:predicted metal-dependent hydrolase
LTVPGGRGRDIAGRDRDTAGRPRSARARDELGRPLPAAEAGQDVPRVPDDLVVSPAEAAEIGARLLAEGRPFHAHEVFEAAWKSAAGAERDLWRGLAQIAVGLTHARRGNARGAVALLRRGAEAVAASPSPDPPAGIDPGFVASQAASLALQIERGGLAGVTKAELRFPLRRA